MTVARWLSVVTDFTISGGSPHNVRKHSRQFTQPLATQYGIPYIQLVEGVGHSAKADEAAGHMGLPGGDLWWKGVELMKRVPVAAGIMGSVAGAPAAFALMSHFTVMVKDQSQIFPSGPPVVRRAIGEQMDKEELGGYKRHVHESGQVDKRSRVRRGCLRADKDLHILLAEHYQRCRAARGNRETRLTVAPKSC